MRDRGTPGGRVVREILRSEGCPRGRGEDRDPWGWRPGGGTEKKGGVPEDNGQG